MMASNVADTSDNFTGAATPDNTPLLYLLCNQKLYRRLVDVERKQAQAIASLPDSITHYYAYSNEDITVISLRLPVP